MSELFGNEFVINELVKGEVIIEEKQEVNKKNETIIEIIKNNTELLIGYEDLKIISKKSDDKYPTQDSEIYKKYINDILIIVNKEVFVYNNKLNIYYKCNTQIEEFLKIFIYLLKIESHKKLSKIERESISISKLCKYE